MGIHVECAITARPGGRRLPAILLLTLLGALGAQSGHAASLADYGRLPSIEDVALSPDGSRLAYVNTKGNQRIVVVAGVADHKVIHWVALGEEKLRDLQWADDDNVMITTSDTTSFYGFKDEWDLLRVYNVSRNEARMLPDTPLAAAHSARKTVVGDVMVRRIGGHTVLFVPGMNVDDEFSLYRCDLNDGSTSLVRAGSSADESWIVDGNGQLAARETYDRETERWSIDVFPGRGSREAASGHAALDAPEILGFGPTADTLLVQSIESGTRVWRLLSINDGKFAAMPEDSVFDTPLSDPLTGRLIGGVNTVDRPAYVFFDPTWESRWKSVVAAFDGSAVTLVSNSSDFSKVVVLLESPNLGYRYILINLEKPEAVPIGKVYAGIDKVLAVQRITYAAGDGLEIPAYLTLPPDRSPRNLPLIVLPHGGPAASDTAEFDWWSQALAAQGYAVLRPNYRGSNLNEKFLAAGFGQWGRKMQTDLSDGVRYLASQGIVDSAKVCIVGASYGGYAALAGVTLDPTVYRCAVSVAGISDLARMMQWEGRGGLDARGVTRYWDRFWGVSGSSDPALDTISPIKHIDAVKAPVLLIHGRDDTVVPYEQSQIMFDALRSQKKDVELVTLKREDHRLSRGETRTQMLEATVAFLRAHNPPD